MKFNETIHHRFRESTDLQYAFLYFHYLDGIGSILNEQPIKTLWKRVDTDLDGVLNQNELQTLNVMCFGSDANRECAFRSFHDA